MLPVKRARKSEPEEEAQTVRKAKSRKEESEEEEEEEEPLDKKKKKRENPTVAVVADPMIVAITALTNRIEKLENKPENNNNYQNDSSNNYNYQNDSSNNNRYHNRNNNGRFNNNRNNNDRFNNNRSNDRGRFHNGGNANFTPLGNRDWKFGNGCKNQKCRYDHPSGNGKGSGKREDNFTQRKKEFTEKGWCLTSHEGRECQFGPRCRFKHGKSASNAEKCEHVRTSACEKFFSQEGCAKRHAE